jgi:RND superfamily putative drug exporter
VREVRSLVSLQPHGSLLGYSVLYSDLPAARATYPDFLDAYLSTDRRLTLMDVILADTTSLTTATDVVLRVRQLAKAGLRGTKGMTITVGGYSAAALDFQEDLLARFPLLVILILSATAVMLAVAFKSVLVPI